MKLFLFSALTLLPIISARSKAHCADSNVVDRNDAEPHQDVFSAASVAGPQVVLGSTTVVGRYDEDVNQDFFGGIPFASPPVGELRLKPPVYLRTPGVPMLNAASFGPGCLQKVLPVPQMSEDCLTINVWRPAGLQSDASLPVMAWVYGGGFSMGASFTYDGSTLVKESVDRGTPIIYVNFNYRVGPLGFPQGTDASLGSVLNLGLKDQLLALQWIQDNIGTFGGDNSQVTVFGESAGSISLAIHFLDPGFESLARAAIFESGSAGSQPVFFPDRPIREQAWRAFVDEVPGCENSVDTLACLRRATPGEILEGLTQAPTAPTDPFPWVPAIDGGFGLLPDLPSEIIKRGAYAHLPFISGTNSDEGTLFTPQAMIEEIIGLMLNLAHTPSQAGAGALNASATTAMELYPNDPALGSPFGTGDELFGLDPAYKRFAAIFNDLNFLSQRRFWIETASNDNVPTYGYLFSDPEAKPDDFLLPTPPPANGSLGVAHSSEINYVYGLLDSSYSSQAQELSKQMVHYWLSFATSLDPNDGKGAQRPRWDQFAARNPTILQLHGGNTTTIADDFRIPGNNFFQDTLRVWNR